MPLEPFRLGALSGQVRTDELRRLVHQVETRDQVLPTAGMLYLQSGSGMTFLPPGAGATTSADQFFPARLTAASGRAYSWAEQEEVASGVFRTLAGGRTGTPPLRPAYELNGTVGIPTGTESGRVVWMTEGFSAGELEEFLFAYELSSAGETQTVQGWLDGSGHALPPGGGTPVLTTLATGSLATGSQVYLHSTSGFLAFNHQSGLLVEDRTVTSSYPGGTSRSFAAVSLEPASLNQTGTVTSAFSGGPGLVPIPGPAGAGHGAFGNAAAQILGSGLKEFTSAILVRTIPGPGLGLEVGGPERTVAAIFEGARGYSTCASLLTYNTEQYRSSVFINLPVLRDLGASYTTVSGEVGALGWPLSGLAGIPETLWVNANVEVLNGRIRIYNEATAVGTFLPAPTAWTDIYHFSPPAGAGLNHLAGLYFTTRIFTAGLAPGGGRVHADGLRSTNTVVTSERYGVGDGGSTTQWGATGTAGDGTVYVGGIAIVLGGGTGPGTVVSVGLEAPASVFRSPVPGSPVTTSGTLQLQFVAQTPRTVFAGPVGAASTEPAFRYLTRPDLPERTVLVTTGTVSVIGTTSGEVTLGSRLILAAHLSAGESLKIEGWGIYTMGTGLPGPVAGRLKVKLGSVTILESALQSPPLSVTHGLWRLECELTFRSVGVAAGCAAQGCVVFHPSATAAAEPVWWPLTNTAPITCDTSTDQTLTMTWEWSGGTITEALNVTNVIVSKRGGTVWPQPAA